MSLVPDELPAAARRGGVAAELILLGTACAILFFVGLGRFEFIETEGLRAIVVKEMLERPGFTLPTVHHVPYLRKPPLYAWTTTWLARQSGGLDEWTARLPSAVSATLLVLLVYVAGRRWIGPAAGYAAAVLLLTNVTVLDYGVRAELDMPFSLFCGLAFAAMALASARPRGAANLGIWLLAYAFALLGSLWKGPHVLIFMWLALIAHAWIGRDRHWLRAPGQWLGLCGCLGVLVWWSRTLAGFTSGGDVGRTALIEVIERLVPHSGGDIVSMFLFPAITVVVTIPASVFILTSIIGRRAADGAVASGAGGARSAHADGPTPASSVAGAAVEPSTAARSSGIAAVARRIWVELHRWATAASADRVVWFLLMLIVPNLLFLMIAPAKAPRYTLPIFAPIALLAAWAVERRFTADRSAAGGGGTLAYETAWRRIGVALMAVGGGAVVPGVAALLGAAGFGPPVPWFVLAGGLAAAGWMLRRVASPQRQADFARWTCLLCVALASKPVIMNAWWPGRLDSDAMRANAAAIDAAVPEDATIHVLKNDDAPDVAFYSTRRFLYVPDVATAQAQQADVVARDTASESGGTLLSPAGPADASAGVLYFLARRSEFEELPHNPTTLPGYRERLTFLRNDREMVLFTLPKKVSG